MDINDENIIRLKFLATQLVSFADSAAQNSCDDRCFLLYGLTRDYGYRILSEAEREWSHHSVRQQAVDKGHERVGVNL